MVRGIFLKATDLPTPSIESELLANSGELGERVLAYDWAATPLGPSHAWPQSLQTSVGLILRARQPMFIAWGTELTLLYNDAYSVVLGSKHPHALGQPFATAWSDIWPQFKPLVERVIAGESLSFDNLPIRMQRNGYPEDTWFNFSYTPVQDEAGQVAGLFCVCLETTGKVLAERQLRTTAAALAELNAELEERVEARTRDRDRIWRLSTDMMLVADFQARIHAVNPAWTAVLGWSQEELIGADFMSLIHPDDVESTRHGVGTLAGGHVTVHFENRYRHKDGTYRWLSWNAVPDERFIHAVGRDVQAEKEAAEVLLRTEEQLRQAQKMEAIGQLTGGLAHDFNNLLAGISGTLELLKIRLEQGRTTDLNRYIDAALGGAGRAAAVTHRLLAFSRRQTLEPKTVLANPLIVGMEELIGRTVGPGITVETRLAGGLWATLCDPHQLENALLNLCINARDAMPDGGHLIIETSNITIGEGRACDHSIDPGQYVTIQVIDSGTGMTSEVRAKAFDPFFTTKPIGSGTGLGLSMIYGFIKQSGGHVQIDSHVGHGTTLCLYLPRHSICAEGGEAAIGDTGTAAKPLVSLGKTALVVDDEPTIRMLLSEVLDSMGCCTIEAADASSALEVVRSEAEIDILISDVGLPGGMNGRQLGDAARQLRPAIKILFITGYAEQAVLNNRLMEPGIQIMTKPFALDVVADRIKDLLTAA